VSKMINWSCRMGSLQMPDGLVRPALASGCDYTNCGLECLAREAQQQQAERERAGLGKAKKLRSPC
jgi:hypothetical protein